MLEKWPEPVKWPDQISRFYDYIIKMCVLIAQLLAMEPREEKTFLLDHNLLVKLKITKYSETSTVSLLIFKQVNLFSHPITTVLLKCFELFSRTL